jgi:hypothetical protein
VKTVRLVTKRPLRRYRNEASALLDKISARLQAAGSRLAACSENRHTSEQTINPGHGYPRKRAPIKRAALEGSVRPLAEQHSDARLEIGGNELAGFVTRARTNGNDLAFLRLFPGGRE